MISGENRGAGGLALVRHLASVKDGQRVQLIAGRHLSAVSLDGQLREIMLGARRNRTTRPILHIHVDPPADYQSPEVFRMWVAEFEQEFHMEEAPRAGVFHVGKRGTNRRHLHLCYGLVSPDGRLFDLRNSYRRREKVGVIVAAYFGLPPPPVPRPRSILVALVKDGREDVAQWMRANYPDLNDRPRVAITTPLERHIAERTGISRAEMLAVIAKAWQAPSANEFRERLAASNLHLAMGDKVPVILDETGTSYSLARTVRSACKLHDLPAPTAAMVHSLVAAFGLPSVNQVKRIRSMAKAIKVEKVGSSGQDIVDAFGGRVRLVRKGPPHRILTTDGGWVVVNRTAQTLQVSGKPGDADDLAQQLAALEGYNVQRVKRRRLRRNPVWSCAPLNQADELAPNARFQWWVSRGHTPGWRAGGIVVEVNGTMLVDQGSRIEVHSLPPSNEAIDEIARFAAANWKGTLRLDVPVGATDWHAADKERLWLACQRHGVRFFGYSPSPALLRRWELEQGEGTQGAAAALRPEIVTDQMAAPQRAVRQSRQELDEAIDQIKGQWSRYARDADRIEKMRVEIARLEALKDELEPNFEAYVVEEPQRTPRA